MALIAVASGDDVGAAPPAADTAAVDVINAPPSPIYHTSTASRFAEAVSLAAGATGGAGAPTDRPFPTVVDIAAVGSPPCEPPLRTAPLLPLRSPSVVSAAAPAISTATGLHTEAVFWGSAKRSEELWIPSSTEE